MLHLTAGTTKGTRVPPSVPLLIALVALVVLAVSPMGTLAQTAPTPFAVSGTPVLLSGGTGNQTDPHIGGTLVSYTNAGSAFSEIRYHDLTTGSDAAIPNDGQRDSLSDVSGTTIVFRRVYTDGSTTKRSIMAYNTANPGAGPIELAPDPDARRLQAAIGGNTVAWMEQVGPSSTQSDIVVHDLDTGETTPLTTDGSSMLNQDPAVSPDGRVVTWAKCVNSGLNCDVYALRQAVDGSWGYPTQISSTSGDDFRPDTNGAVIVYASNPGGEFDIWWENVDGTGERQLSLPGTQFNPKMAGNLISFESDAVGSTNGDLFVYDLATEHLYQVTNTPDVDETLNDISLGSDGVVRVVWAQADGLSLGQNDIYAMTFSLDSDPALYDICPYFDQSRSYRLKSTVPIRLQLCDTDGQNLSSSSIVITATELVKRDGAASTTVVDDAGNANPDNNFRYDPTIGGSGGYIYNLSTKGLSQGTWELRFTVSGDPSIYSVTFDLR